MQSATDILQLQERDFILLKDLFESRMITIRHAAALYFGGNKNLAQRRLQRLAQAGVIRQKALAALRGKAEAVYFYTQTTFDVLQKHGHLSHYECRDWVRFLRKRAHVAESTVRHELAVLDVKALLEPALKRQAHIRLIEFGTIPALYEFMAPHKGRRKLTKPDGFLRYLLHFPNRPHPIRQDFFLEVDRGTETLNTLVLKAEAYRHHYTSGDFAARQGGPDAAKEDYPFRALFLMPNVERLNNLLERLLLLRYGKNVWLTTLAELRERPLGPVWRFPAAYAEGVKGGPYDPRGYARERIVKPVHQPARDAFVAERVRKWSLLEDPKSAVHTPREPSVLQWENAPAAMS